MLTWFTLFVATDGARWLWLSPIMFAGYGMFLLGFLVWSRPIVLKAASSSLAKWGHRIAHGFFLIFAIVIARNIVAGALKLPPQYFEVTVSLVALISYVPVCIGASFVFLIGLFIGTFSLWGIRKLMLQFIYSFAIPFLGRPKWLNRFIAKLEMRAAKVFFHAIGAAVMMLVLAASIDGFNAMMRYAAPGIRWFAYMADFQPAGRYPGVSCNGRVRLQDNGVVAVAQVVHHDIEFKMENFRTDPGSSKGCV